MSIEKQKADLLDDLMNYWIEVTKNPDVRPHTTIFMTMEKYQAITSQKPLTSDPYIDEIFSGRLLTIIKLHWGVNHPFQQLSQLPKLSFWQNTKGFGRKSREEYIEVMTKYNFLDKI